MIRLGTLVRTRIICVPYPTKRAKSHGPLMHSQEDEDRSEIERTIWINLPASEPVS